MEKAQAYIRIQELRDIINEANRKYYVENSPTLSDYEFDMLLKELEALEKEHPELVKKYFAREIEESGLQREQQHSMKR